LDTVARSAEKSKDLLETIHSEMKTKYAKLVTKLKKQGAEDPKALAAFIGRKKLGAEEFQRRAAAGRRKAAR